VDELRGKVYKFCREMIPFEDPDGIKIVYFEEFDTATSSLQEELKSFIEDNSLKVRFLATCNKIGKITPEIKSRFTEVDFTLIGDEVKEVKIALAKRIKNICREDNINISDEILKDIINKRMPDIRKVWQDIQLYHKTGYTVPKKIMDDDSYLFQLVLNKKNGINIWEFLMKEWIDKIDIAFLKFGVDFFEWIKENHPEKNDRFGNALIVISDYCDLRLPNASDPFVTLCAMIYKLQEIYK